MNKDLRIANAGKLQWRKDGEDYIVHQYETDMLFKVPEIAIMIFQLADGSKTTDTIIKNIIYENNLGLEQYNQLYEFIIDLEQEKLLKYIQE